MAPSIDILGINFLDCDVNTVITEIDAGGLLVVPSGPGLASIEADPEYAKAVRAAKFAIADSGFMVACLRALNRPTPKRVSGLKLVRALLTNKTIMEHRRILWVVPRDSMKESIQNLLANKSEVKSEHHFTVAPQYSEAGPIEDKNLLGDCLTVRPDWIVLCIAGGKQEKLGAFLSRELPKSTTVICIGAAIAFETGDQATIPANLDELKLGWLLRILGNPKLYLPRYIHALKLAGVLWSHKQK